LQFFPRGANYLPLVVALGAPVVGASLVGAVWYFGSPRFTDVGYRPRQPVPYSHALHAGKLGLDCRYCHASVESARVANLPPTKVCMNCHQTVKRDSPLLEPVRQSMATGRPIRWVRVHNLPDYSYFDHGAHVRAGVGCVSCHGPIQTMEVVAQAEPLSMGWCLDCHRNPARRLRPVQEVTNMDWSPPRDYAVWAAEAASRVRPPVDCSGCHR